MSDKATAGGVVIVADHREAASGVIKHLSALNALVRAGQLETGDYVLSDRVAVERKTVSDFASSIMDNRMFEQLGRLAKSYEKPILILEGDQDAAFAN